MKAIYAKLKNRIEIQDILAAIGCLIISFAIKVMIREIPL